MKRPTDKTAPRDQKPPTARKPSRITKEILKVIEEYASTQREFLKALRKRFFISRAPPHQISPIAAPASAMC